MPILPPPGRARVASFPQRCSLTSETVTCFDLRSLKVTARSSHMRKSSCWSFFSESWNAASSGGMAKINHPWPASTQENWSTSRKKARSASGSLEQTTTCAAFIKGELLFLSVALYSHCVATLATGLFAGDCLLMKNRDNAQRAQTPARQVTVKLYHEPSGDGNSDTSPSSLSH